MTTRANMTREEMRRHIEESEAIELKHMTAEEAFEAGRRGDFEQYDLAARKVALILLKLFEKQPVDFRNYGYLQKGKANIFDVIPEEARARIDAIAPSGLQMSWAIGSVRYALGG